VQLGVGERTTRVALERELIAISASPHVLNGLNASPPRRFLPSNASQMIERRSSRGMAAVAVTAGSGIRFSVSCWFERRVGEPWKAPGAAFVRGGLAAADVEDLSCGGSRARRVAGANASCGIRWRAPACGEDGCRSYSRAAMSAGPCAAVSRSSAICTSTCTATARGAGRRLLSDQAAANAFGEQLAQRRIRRAARDRDQRLERRERVAAARHVLEQLLVALRELRHPAEKPPSEFADLVAQRYAERYHADRRAVVSHSAGLGRYFAIVASIAASSSALAVRSPFQHEIEVLLADFVVVGPPLLDRQAGQASAASKRCLRVGLAAGSLRLCISP
jgi:hypothetical protein